MAAEEEPTVVSEPTEKTKKAMLRGYRQKLSAIHARIKYREKTQNLSKTSQEWYVSAINERDQTLS